jgi:hypothetical protein
MTGGPDFLLFGVGKDSRKLWCIDLMHFAGLPMKALSEVDNSD